MKALPGDFLQRALVTLTLGPIGLVVIFLGGWFYFLPVAAILTIATIEYSHLIGTLGWRVPLWILTPAAMVQWILPESVQQMLLGSVVVDADLVAPVLLISFLAALSYALWLYEQNQVTDAVAAWLATTSGIVLLGWLGSHFFRIRSFGSMAAEWTAIAMVGTWVADSAAYVFGKTLGRHRLSPRLSPNKTVEGYIGGILVGTAVAVWMAILFGIAIWVGLILGVLITTVSPAGDLGISLLKRRAGVKDSGHFLPGHGGALDRTDSLVWSVAMVYYVALLTG